MRELLLTQGNLSRKLRQLLVFLTLVLVPIGVCAQYEDYSKTIYVDSKGETIWIKSNNAEDILEDGGSMIYDADNNVLTLDNVNLSCTTSGATFISCVDWSQALNTLTIRLVGSNTITLGNNAGFFYGSALTFITDDNYPGSLTITKQNGWNGKLFENSDSGDPTITPTFNNHLYLDHDGESECLIQWLVCPGPFSYNNGNNIVFLFGNETGNDDEVIHYSIDYVDENQQDVTDAVFDVEGGYLPLLGPCTMTYYITAGGGQSETKTAKLFGLATNTVSTNLGIPVALPTIVPAFNHSEDLIITETQTPATGLAPSYDGTSGLISTFATGETTCSVKLSNSTANGYDYLVLNDNDDNEKHIFGNFTLTVNGAVNYGITVGGVEVTSANAANIIGDGIENGTVTFTPASDSNGNINTLTLTDATLTEPIVSSLDNLTIHLVGSNNIQGTTGNPLANAISSTVSTATLTFTSDVDVNSHPTGKLLFQYVNTKIDGFSSITYNNGLGQGYVYDSSNPDSNQWGIGEIKYGLSIGNIQVTSANYSDIKNDGNSTGASYDNALYVLTLENATLTDAISWNNDANFKIDLKGTNSITTNGSCITTTANGKNISFTRSGASSLELSSGTSGADIITGFSNSQAPTMGSGLFWFPTENGNNNIISALITTMLGGGSGTSTSPFIISSYDHLKEFANYVNSGILTTQYVKLNGNIDCTNKTDFVPIGNDNTHPFNGNFDGNSGGGYSISNLNYAVNSSDVSVGLFGIIDGGTVQNLTLSSCSFTGGNKTGAIAGYLNAGTIKNCNVNSCTIESGGTSIGAVVGYKESTAELSTNFYNSAVTVKTTTGGNTTTKSGQTQRGIGNGNDVLNQVMLSGTKKITIVCTETYNSEYYPKEGTYYLFEDINSIYALPNSVVTINAYPASDYIPALSLTDNITVTTEEKTESGVYHHTEFSFTMPNADVTATLTFSSIINYDIASCTVILPEDVTYIGEAFEPYIYETATATTPLTPGTDYTVSYQKTDGGTATDVDAMIDAGTYKITITGAGNYTGTKEVSNFQIGQADLDDATISKLIFGGQEYTGTDIEIPYTGAAIQPSVVVTINDGQVTIDPSEYSVSWSDNIEISGTDESAKVTITSTGKNFTENSYTEKNFKIVRGDVTITANDQTVTYNGNAQEYSNATVDNANATLAIAYYPTVTDRAQGSNKLTGAPTDAGTYYVEVTQTNDNFMADDQFATFTIEQAEITEVILEQTELIYNKEEQTVNVDKVMAGTLEVDADYYEISGNIGTELGDYTVTVTAKENSGSFKNNFKGSATTTFKIIKKTVTIADLGLSDSQTFATYYNTNEDVYLPDGVVAYIIVGVSENSVTVKRISYIPKGVAVLVELGSSSETAGDDADGNLLVGTSTQIDVTAITGGTVYVLYNGEFVKTITGIIPANHCYLVTTASSSRKLTIVCDDTTAIDNGRLTMDNEAGEQWYDLQGWKIEKPNKAGLYIKNGKKTVIYNK